MDRLIQIKRSVLTIAFIVASFLLSAQYVTPVVLSAGGTSIVKSNTYYAYTIGETFVSTSVGQDFEHYLSQGFHQPWGVYLTNILEIDNEISLNVFPNPADDYFDIKIDGTNEHQFTVILVSGAGQEIEVPTENFWSNQETRIRVDIRNLKGGIYILRIHKEFKNQLIGVSKVVKFR